MVGDSKYGTFDDEFLPMPISPPVPKFCYANIAFCLIHCFRRHTCMCYSCTRFLHHLGTGCCLPKNNV